MRFLTPPHPLTNYEIQKYYQNESRFNGAYSRDNPPNKIEDGAYVINLWIALYALNNNVTYFHTFGVEHIPKEIKKFIGNKNIQANIFRIQEYDSLVCEFVCFGFIDSVSKDKSLTEFTNLFSPNDLKK